tara:strand:+ start:960 stop:1922 length:963 start_codon:yes stop_codon:yes gene_type:complete
MNIFENYLLKINRIILDNKDKLKLKNTEFIKNINLEVPPEHVNFDLSTNVSLILSKVNKVNTVKLANDIKNLLLKKINHFENIEIAGPGFLNIKLSKEALAINIKDILKDKDVYGSKKSNKTYNVEFVSANPTGPMHVGHCRGAIFGDILSNLLKFNGNKVVKEYYINDYGNQIKNFVKSVYQRLREIKFGEAFIVTDDLYPGIYIKEIAFNILKNNQKINLDNFENCYEKLRKLSLKESMILIKDDLKKLGIVHDNFFSESDLVQKDLVNKTILKLKNKNLVEEGYLNPPKGETPKTWKKIKRLIFKSTLFDDDANRAL